MKRQTDAEKREAEVQKRRAEADAAAMGIQQCADRSLSPHPTGETDAGESDTGVAVQTEMTMEDVQLLEQQCISLNERLYGTCVEKEELEISENGFSDNAHVLWNCPGSRAAMGESLKHIPTRLRPATLEEWLADSSPNIMKALLRHLTLLGLSEG
ncbi:hypothetical protein HPB50_016331 [Hyalomma asiaticum]|uniref:Uncharacterized protein n=1 Tax=Hyalomma asiaticum TaxID=266040 RepID=A0ACB7SP22_HYAAI|nr:hypothetical protein HPB50_016331 [Hyalomma asiaticum]